MKTLFASSFVVVVVALGTVTALSSACSQQVPGCQVSAALPYAALYSETSVPAANACSGLKGDNVGMAAYNPLNADRTAPDLSKASMAIRTTHLGALVANADANGITDSTKGDNPFAFGPFKDGTPTADICTATPNESAHMVLAAIPEDLGDPESPDDDIPAQAAVDMQEEWSAVQVYVTASAVGTQVKAHYKLTDNVEGCTAEYDVLALFPSVACRDDVPGDGVSITTIQEVAANASGLRLIQVDTAGPHGLSVGDAIVITGVDDADGVATYDGTYTVGTKLSETSFITAEIDPGDDSEPDPVVHPTEATVAKLTPTGNEDYCNPVAQPDKGFPVGSGINPDFPTKCDPDLFVCVLDADPSKATLPVLKK